MKEITEKETRVLLTLLDREINLKCEDILERNREIKLRRLFFSACLLVLSAFLLQIFYRIFNISFLFMFLIYQGLVLTVIMPVIMRYGKGGLLK